jgi:UDP-2,4-diacetamido-2,4,6-trideoxy-beta-L-altropyranose hydrolase
MSRTLLIRADASTQIGTGHVMRCMALAERWQHSGGRAHLLTRARTKGLLQLVAERGIDVSQLPADLPLLDDSLATTRLARALGADWLVIDGYHFDSTYQDALAAAGLRALVIDDMAEQPHYRAAALLNQNIGAESHDYRLDPQTLPLFGPRYVLLRRQFDPWQNSKRTIPAVAEHILVTLGGADPDNVTATVIAALKRAAIPHLQARVIVGAANPHLASLRAIAADSPSGRIELLSSVADMPEQMAWADMAVAAGGTTCWELLFMGLPTLLLTLAPNQAENVRDLQAVGAARSLGTVADQMAVALTDLAFDQPARQAMSGLGRAIVDGSGGLRVLSSLMLSSDGADEWRLRPATAADAFLLWQWANEPSARANSFHAEPIPWGDHLSWYQARLASADSRIWLLERRGAPVGIIRYDRADPHRAELSFAVTSSQRGLGIGTRLLTMSLEPAMRELGVSTVEGTVFAANGASARSFLKAGYTQAEPKTIAGRPCLIFRRAAQ